MNRTATLALAASLIAFGFCATARGDENSEIDACERFAEHFVHTSGQVDQVSRRQCNIGLHAECEDTRRSLQKNVANGDDKLNRYFFSLLPCGDTQYSDPDRP